MIGRLGRTLRRLVVAAAVLLLAVALLGKLPSGTGPGSLAWRAATGAAAGVLLVGIVRRSMRSLVSPPPAAPETIDARAVAVVYTCAVCGTRVRLEVAATGKPPKHCGEEMESRVSD